ncbi:hypothetical protein QAD02_018295, partial [Eretmocerus hayati]
AHQRSGKMLDTGTVRLVILLGMFLYFAGDYSALLAAIWGSAEEDSANGTLKRLPEGPPKDAGPQIDRIVIEAARKQLGGEEAEDNEITRRAKMMTTIKTACLPKLICELTSISHQDQLSEMERSLLNLI